MSDPRAVDNPPVSPRNSADELTRWHYGLLVLLVCVNVLAHDYMGDGPWVWVRHGLFGFGVAVVVVHAHGTRVAVSPLRTAVEIVVITAGGMAGVGLFYFLVWLAR